MERRHTLTRDEALFDHLEPRRRRALAETMHVTFARTGGRYTVHASSGRDYDVDVVDGTCSFPDFQSGPPAGGCKHLRRVDMEIRAGTMPTPDGRLPSRATADGGTTAETRSDEPIETGRIEGPILEFDRHGKPTGETYFRCMRCGREAMRARDLETAARYNRSPRRYSAERPAPNMRPVHRDSNSACKSALLDR